MIFNSLAFAVFLPIVFLIYWAIPEKYRYIVLLAASYYFYMSWSPKYVLLIMATTLISYFCAVFMGKTEEKGKRKRIFVAALLVSILILVFFKYFNFLSGSVIAVLNSLAIPVHPLTLKIMLPVGISFYTFQSLGYVIDVYKGKVQPEKHLGKYALFVSFFPVILSGPIERSTGLLPQLNASKTFDYNQAVYGLRQMLLGFIKKLIIADALSKYVDMIFQDVHSYFGLTFIVAAILYTFQIYCDFSGYSDIAIGVSKLLGIDLMTNFKSPYLSKSVREFWSRWHISLSTWFRDYVYIPLGGSRVSTGRRDLNVIITFLVSGLWHGANWTFVIWGGLHGLYQVIENHINGRKSAKRPEEGALTKEVKTPGKLSGFFRGFITFGLVSFAWIFFRADSVSDAFYVVTHLHNGIIHFANSVTKMLVDMQLTYLSFGKLVVALTALMAYDYFSLKRDLLQEMGRLKWPLRWCLYIGLTSLIIVLKIHNGTNQEFIYFKF